MSLIFSFYKTLIFKSKGLVTNNITNSYNYLTIKKSAELFNISNLQKITTHNNEINNYVKPIKVLNFFIKKYKFNKMVFIVLMYIIQFNIYYYNCTNFSYSFIYTPNIINFYNFYNYYYFKIYNY